MDDHAVAATLVPPPIIPPHAAAAPPDQFSTAPGRHRHVWPCKSFSGASSCGMEWDEWQLVDALIGPNDVVLELGGRYGTTACVIARATGNSGNVVSVEPDARAHKELLTNRARHNCSFHALLGAVGDAPVALRRGTGHYATQTQPVASGGSSQDEVVVVSLPVAALERSIGHPFTALLIDCEGCIDHFFVGSTLQRLLLDAPPYGQLQLILMEEDVPHEVDYPKWHARFRKHGFERIWKVRDTFDPKAEWSRNITHSAWRRGGLGPTLPSCEAYRARAWPWLRPSQRVRWGARWLDCLDPGGV